jgi:hypothetical protein
MEILLKRFYVYTTCLHFTLLIYRANILQERKVVVDAFETQSTIAQPGTVMDGSMDRLTPDALAQMMHPQVSLSHSVCSPTLSTHPMDPTTRCLFALSTRKTATQASTTPPPPPPPHSRLLSVRQLYPRSSPPLLTARKNLVSRSRGSKTSHSVTGRLVSRTVC